jgi:hypothetical protein
MRSQEYKPPLPEVEDSTARTLLWITLGISIINMLMIGYVFYVVEKAVEVLHQLGQQ